MMVEETVGDSNLTEEEAAALAEAAVEEADQKLYGGYGYPDPPSKESVFKFFRHILQLEDNSKVGNLVKEEIGYLRHTVRRYQDLANYASTMGLKNVSKYLDRKADIILATSLSRKGFLAQLFVTQIKRQQKIMPHQPKTGWFQKPEGGGEGT